MNKRIRNAVILALLLFALLLTACGKATETADTTPAAETVQTDPATDPAPETTAEETEPPVEREAPGWLISKQSLYDANGVLEDEVAYEYDAEGNMIRQTLTVKDYPSVLITVFEYDEAGNQTAEFRYEGDSLIQTTYTRYEFDDQGNIVLTVNSDEKGKERSRTETTYVEDGDLVKQIEYSYYGGNLTGLTETAFDANGNLVENTMYNEDGTVEYSEKAEYNESGSVTWARVFSADGTIMQRIKYDYDEEGRKIQEVVYDSEGSVYSRTVMEYDSEGNLSEVVATQKSYQPTYYRLTYDEYGNMLTKSRYYGKDGATLYDKEVYEYVYIP